MASSISREKKEEKKEHQKKLVCLATRLLSLPSFHSLFSLCSLEALSDDNCYLLPTLSPSDLGRQ